MKIFPSILIKAYVNSMLHLLGSAQKGGFIGNVTRGVIANAIKGDPRWSGPDEAINVGRAALLVMRDLVPAGRIGANDFKKLYRESRLCLSGAWEAYMTRKEFSTHFASALSSMRMEHSKSKVWPTLH